jgi:hypothetical protein
MSKKTKIEAGLLLILLNLYVVFNTLAQDIPPLVYDVENTGADCTKPPLPTLGELPIVPPLTDPFEWSDGSGRSTDFADWCRRRAEIGEEIQNYEIGPKPLRPDTISANYAGDSLTVYITKNGQTLMLTSHIVLPEGTGPFPAVIGMGSPTGSLPSDIFTSRNVALIPFNFSQVMQWQQVRGREPINKLYPDLTYMGAYAAWSWGVSRLIDGLELVQGDLNIDLTHLAVTGCSFAGKMALFAGAFDERIALTIPQESGGGGVAAWRVSQNLGAVENLGSTSNVWFMTSLFQFAGGNVPKLPYDHHELVAMIAPRACFVIGNPSQIWLAEESGYVSSQAAKKVWDTFGISDRFGFSFVTDHPHCALPEAEVPEVGAFVDKFLLGDTLANTDISTNSYDFVDVQRWVNWWGSDTAVFPNRDAFGTESVFLEPECGTVGLNIKIIEAGGASVGYLMINTGFGSISEAPADSASNMYIPFTVTTDTTFYVFERSFCSDQNKDSYWVKMDDGEYVKYDGLYYEGGWAWKSLGSYELTPGEHTLAIAFCEEGSRFDKLCVSSYAYYPVARADTAVNLCEPDYTPPPTGLDVIKSAGEFALGQNYPNPFNANTTIPFVISTDTYVSLKVYNILGDEIAELAAKVFTQGEHTVEFNAKNLSKGIYYYTIKTDNFSASRKMIIRTE